MLGSGHTLAKAHLRMPVSILRNEDFLTMWRKKTDSIARDTCTEIVKSEIQVVMRELEALVRIYGRIDIDSSPDLRAHLLTMLKARAREVVRVDLSGVTHIDSAGIATLIDALRIARSYHTEVRLVGLEGRLLRLFQSTGILSLFMEASEKNGSSGQGSQPGSKAV
jgi:anti-sigma B factor antagonist